MPHLIYYVFDTNTINIEALQLQYIVNNIKTALKSFLLAKLWTIRTLFNYRQTAKVTLLYLRKIIMCLSVDNVNFFTCPFYITLNTMYVRNIASMLVMNHSQKRFYNGNTPKYNKRTLPGQMH